MSLYYDYFCARCHIGWYATHGRAILNFFTPSQRCPKCGRKVYATEHDDCDDLHAE